MKKWLARFGISTALDREPPSAQAETEQMKQSVAMHELDARLQASLPSQPLPPGLHAGIMRAVRRADARRTEPTPSLLWRWLPASALAIGLVVAFFWAFTRPPHDSQSLNVAATALEPTHA